MHVYGRRMFLLSRALRAGSFEEPSQNPSMPNLGLFTSTINLNQVLLA